MKEQSSSLGLNRAPKEPSPPNPTPSQDEETDPVGKGNSCGSLMTENFSWYFTGRTCYKSGFWGTRGKLPSERRYASDLARKSKERGLRNFSGGCLAYSVVL